MPKFGPGSLIFGETGTEFDVSCDVNSLTIEASKNQGDSRTMLCGTVRPGAITYEWSMGGNLDIDSHNPEGFFAFTQANPGSQVPFVFVPNSAAETSASGVVIIDPLTFGGDEYGADMASDIEFTIVGQPAYTYPAAAAALSAGALVNLGSTKAGTVSKETAAALEKLQRKYNATPAKEAPADA